MNSIVWKLVLPLPLALVTLVVAVWLFLPDVILDNARQDITLHAVSNAQQFKKIRSYYSANIVRKAQKSNDLKPAVDHHGTDNRIPIPATFVQDLSTVLVEEDTRMYFYSGYPWPNRADRKLDDFQQMAWDKLNEDPDAVVSQQMELDGHQVLRVAISDKLTAEGCVNCHNNHPDTPRTGWKLNDVRGVLEITTIIDKHIDGADSLSQNVIIALVAGGVLLSGIFVGMTRTIANPLVQLTGHAERITGNNIDDEVPHQNREDEIGLIAHAVEGFRNALQRSNQLEKDRLEAEEQSRLQRAQALSDMAQTVETETRNVVSSVSEGTRKLRESADRMRQSSVSVSANAGTVADAAEQSLSNAEGVVNSSAELSSSINNIYDIVGQQSRISLNAAEEAEATSQTISGLNEAAEQIGEVIDLINNIAAQTNMLALNATIEAARAGESGKGFAVVASEVKNLATQTGQATEEIQGQIAAIQEMTNASVGAIQRVSGTVKELNDLAASISSAVEQQRQATSEITGTMTETTEVYRGVTSKISSVSTESQSATALADEVGAVSEELVAQVAELQDKLHAILQDAQKG